MRVGVRVGTDKGIIRIQNDVVWNLVVGYYIKEILYQVKDTAGSTLLVS